MTSLSFDGLNKGRYVELTAGGTKARRQLGFCDGVVVSASHIRPGELVAVEILETQPGWSGDLRVGFTLLPDETLHPLPSFAIPELVTRGQSWIVPVGNAASLLVSHRRRAYWRRQQQQRRSTRVTDRQLPVTPAGIPTQGDQFAHGRSDTPATSNRSEYYEPFQRVHLNPASPCTCCLYTSFGRVALRRLLPTDGVFLRPPDVEKGSIVAIYYELDTCSPGSEGSTVIDYFRWPPHPIYGDPNETGDDSNDAELAMNDDRTVNETGPAHEPQHLHTTRSSPLLDPLCFHFRFHIVINGIDLVTVAEQITLRPDQLCSNDQSPGLRTNPDSWTLGSPVSNPAIYFPKMRAVLDVYGQTKAVQLVQLQQDPIPRLSRLSSCVILRRIMQIHAPRTMTTGPTTTDNNDASPCHSDGLRDFRVLSHSSTAVFTATATTATTQSFTRAKAVASSTSGLPDDAHPIWSNQSTLARIMDSSRCQSLLAILNQLPLPPSMRLELQRDACAIVWRELVE